MRDPIRWFKCKLKPPNKINCELAKLFTVETQDEAAKGITKLDIMSTERLGRYNPA